MKDSHTRLQDTRRRFLWRAGLTALGVGVIPLLQACGGASGGGGQRGWLVVMNDQLKFAPDKLTIKVGDSVTWRNDSKVVHTVTDDPAKAQDKSHAKLPADVQAWDSGNVAPGASWSRTFDKPGEYAYFCIPHEATGMVATLTVTP